MMQNPAFLAESAGLLPLTERLCYLNAEIALHAPSGASQRLSLT